MICAEFHLLELWAENGKIDDGVKETISHLTDSQILSDINSDSARSGLTGHPMGSFERCMDIALACMMLKMCI